MPPGAEDGLSGSIAYDLMVNVSKLHLFTMSSAVGRRRGSLISMACSRLAAAGQPSRAASLAGGRRGSVRRTLTDKEASSGSSNRIEPAEHRRLIRPCHTCGQSAHDANVVEKPFFFYRQGAEPKTSAVACSFVHRCRAK